MTYDGIRKPAFTDVQRSYTTTQQLIAMGSPPTPTTT